MVASNIRLDSIKTELNTINCTSVIVTKWKEILKLYVNFLKNGKVATGDKSALESYSTDCSDLNGEAIHLARAMANTYNRTYYDVNDGYMLSASDERAMREYILHYCPKLKNEGIKKVGFIIVSNTFKPGFDEFINDITWNTDIKRFSFLNSEALLHLLAYKIKDQLPLTAIIDAIVSLGSTISATDIIQKLDDI
jgi:hypothetical protein